MVRDRDELRDAILRNRDRVELEKVRERYENRRSTRDREPPADPGKDRKD